MNNRLSFSIGGSVGVYMEDLAEPPPANLLGYMQVDYIIAETPSYRETKPVVHKALSK
jgi:hypothetical protein